MRVPNRHLGDTFSKSARNGLWLPSAAALDRNFAEVERSFDNGPAPIGTIWEYAGTTAPNTFWRLADGTALSRTTFDRLFALIGTTYGAGDGSTTFNIPNRKGRAGVGRDAAQAEFDVLGETGGAKTHTLVTGELPVHNHSISGDGSHTHPTGWNGAAAGSSNSIAIASFGDRARIDVQTHDSPGNHSHGGATGNAGSGTAHNNLQPYLVLNYIIRVL